MRTLQADRIIKDVGRRIAERRADLGLTQEQLAERLGIATNNLQRIELGMQNLTVRTIVRICEQLEVAPIDLFKPPRSRAVKTGRPPRRAGVITSRSGSRRRSQR